MTEGPSFVGFDAELEVDDFSYRFPEKWGGDGQKHVIPEPSTELMAQFWAEWNTMTMVGRSTTQPPENESDADRDARLARQISEGQHNDNETFERRRELLALVCGGEPSIDDLKKLPFRVLNAFQGYVIGKLVPQLVSAATTSDVAARNTGTSSTP